MKVIIKVLCITLVVACAATLSHAAEGGYSNYIPGTYGDFAVAVEPPTKFTVRNDIYYYQADGGRSLRSGLIEADADLEFIIDFLTLLYKPDIEICKKEEKNDLKSFSLYESVRGNLPVCYSFVRTRWANV